MQRTRLYKHKVQYYETDQMQVVHHSNYIRWFEEARMDFLERTRLGYPEMEERGIVCPVLEVQANYLRMVRFGDTVAVKIEIKNYNGIKLVVGYQVISKETGLVHCTGETKHCFLNNKNQPIFLKRDHPDIHEMFMKTVETVEKPKRKIKKLNIDKINYKESEEQHED